jgi:hypothetical protein
MYFFNHVFGAVLAHRADEVPVRPELPAPQLLLNLGAGSEDFSGRDALDELHDPFRAVRRHRLHEEVHVVCVSPDLQKRHLEPLTDFQADLFELTVNGRREHRPPILRRANDVVHQD